MPDWPKNKCKVSEEERNLVICKTNIYLPALARISPRNLIFTEQMTLHGRKRRLLPCALLHLYQLLQGLQRLCQAAHDLPDASLQLSGRTLKGYEISQPKV